MIRSLAHGSPVNARCKTSINTRADATSGSVLSAAIQSGSQSNRRADSGCSAMISETVAVLEMTRPRIYFAAQTIVENLSLTDKPRAVAIANSRCNGAATSGDCMHNGGSTPGAVLSLNGTRKIASSIASCTLPISASERRYAPSNKC